MFHHIFHNYFQLIQLSTIIWQFTISLQINGIRRNQINRNLSAAVKLAHVMVGLFHNSFSNYVPAAIAGI